MTETAANDTESGHHMTSRRTRTLICCTFLLMLPAACGGGGDEPLAGDAPPAATTSPLVTEPAVAPDDGADDAPDETANEREESAPRDGSFIRVVIGDESWELQAATSPVDTCKIRNFGGQFALSLAFTTGANATLQGNADGFDPGSIIEITPDLENARYVRWLANESATLSGGEPGQSGIESLEIDENGATGTASFLLDNDGTAGGVSPGTFEIVCVDG